MRMLTWSTGAVFALSLVFPGVTPSVAQQDLDSVKADAAHHTLEFENDQVRVVRYKIGPGEKTANHYHPNNVNIYLTDANAKITTPDGKTTEVHGKAGSAAWRGSTTHVVENIGDKPLEGILVEPKTPHSAIPSGSQDVLASDAKHHKVEFENEQVRIVRYHLEAGETTAMHGHPDNVQVYLTDTKGEVTTADGKTGSATAKAGDVRWRTAIQHAVKNVGDKAFEGFHIDMKGAPRANTRGQ